MPRTIRVFPGGAAGLGGAGGFGGAGAWNQSWGIGGHPAAEMARSTVDHTKDLARTQLDYERQLVEARVKRAQSETLMKYLPNAVGFQNPYGVNPMVAPGGFGVHPGVVPTGFHGAYGGANIAALPGMMAMSLGARGQVNSTTQSSAGAASQSVTNANTLNANHYNMGGLQHSPYASTGVPGFGMGGWGGFGHGGLLGGLGGLIGRLF